LLVLSCRFLKELEDEFRPLEEEAFLSSVASGGKAGAVDSLPQGLLDGDESGDETRVGPTIVAVETLNRSLRISRRTGEDGGGCPFRLGHRDGCFGPTRNWWLAFRKIGLSKSLWPCKRAQDWPLKDGTGPLKLSSSTHSKRIRLSFLSPRRATSEKRLGRIHGPDVYRYRL